MFNNIYFVLYFYIILMNSYFSLGVDLILRVPIYSYVTILSTYKCVRQRQYLPS